MKLFNETTNEYGSTPGLIKKWLLRWMGKTAHISTWHWGVLTPGGLRVFRPEDLTGANQLSKAWGSTVRKFIEIP